MLRRLLLYALFFVCSYQSPALGLKVKFKRVALMVLFKKNLQVR
jgi:hypothetical protein